MLSLATVPAHPVPLMLGGLLQTQPATYAEAHKQGRSFPDVTPRIFAELLKRASRTEILTSDSVRYRRALDGTSRRCS